MTAAILLIAVTAVWGVTFVQVKDAVAIYPLFAFLAVRYAIGSAVLLPPAALRLRALGRNGFVAGSILGVLLAAGLALQTAGLERTTVTNTGFITGLYVLLTPLFALALFHTRITRELWIAVALALLGLTLLAGVPSSSATGDLLVLASTAAQALQIVMVERYAGRYEAVGLVFVEILVACIGCTAIALVLGDLSVPHGRTVWGALIVTGVFASALAYLIQIWAQQRISATRIAVIFSLETVWAGFFGYVLDGDRLGLLGLVGCGLIFLAILVAEPAAAAVLRRLARR
ncbi:MAG TPA: DMT family transporter [Gaiellaceae bacterium]|nr:DMT family transporter [Gaiellaceae bacterium]